MCLAMCLGYLQTSFSSNLMPMQKGWHKHGPVTFIASCYEVISE